MPTYDYECENCGPFTENRPMAEFELPQPCPDCGEASPRLLTMCAIGGGAQQDSGAGMSAMASHPGGCACCVAPRRFTADAV